MVQPTKKPTRKEGHNEQTALQWRTTSVKLGALKPQPDNPRVMTAKGQKLLNDSFEAFDQVDLLAVGPDWTIYNGHARHCFLLEKFGPNHKVDVRQASRALNDTERKKLTALLHKAEGQFDIDALLNWGVEEDLLLSWGFDPTELNIIDVDEKGTDPEMEMDGMPGFESDNECYRTLKVHFRNQADLDRFLTLVRQTITQRTKFIWYPEAEIVSAHTQIYDSSTA